MRGLEKEMYRFRLGHGPAGTGVLQAGRLVTAAGAFSKLVFAMPEEESHATGAIQKRIARGTGTPRAHSSGGLDVQGVRQTGRLDQKSALQGIDCSNAATRIAQANRPSFVNALKMSTKRGAR